MILLAKVSGASRSPCCIESSSQNRAYCSCCDWYVAWVDSAVADAVNVARSDSCLVQCCRDGRGLSLPTRSSLSSAHLQHHVLNPMRPSKRTNQSGLLLENSDQRGALSLQTHKQTAACPSVRETNLAIYQARQATTGLRASENHYQDRDRPRGACDDFVKYSGRREGVEAGRGPLRHA